MKITTARPTHGPFGKKREDVPVGAYGRSDDVHTAVSRGDGSSLRFILRPSAAKSTNRSEVVPFAESRLSLRERTVFRGAKDDKLYHYQPILRAGATGFEPLRG